MSIPTIRRVGTRTLLLLLVLALQFIVSIFLGVGRVSAQTPSGLVAAYGFEEGTGITVADLSGNGNVGTINGATWTTSGKYGKALSFNGSNALVTINDSALLRLTTGMTLEAWVFPTTVNSAWRDVIYKGNDNYYLSGTSDNGGVPAVGGTFGGNVYGTAPLPANTWTHLAATYDGTTMRLYVNGVQVSSRAQTGNIATSANPLQIGGDSIFGQYWSGRIDEVRVYNRALTATEVQTDMNTAIGGNIPPSVSITSPAAGAAFTAPANINITASASDSDGTISKVDFYQGGTLIGTDTTAPYNLTWSNVVAGNYVLTAVATDNAAATSTSSPVNITVSSTAQSIGVWSSVIPLPIVPIHMHLLPNGKVLIWQDDNNPNYNVNGSRGPGLTVAYIWDVSAGTFTEIDNTTDDLFCSGHSFLPDGRLLVAGGHISDGVGIRTTSIFDYRSNSWSTGSLMNAGRWYPTTTSLANGELLVVSGDVDSTQGVNTLPQVWQTNGGWRSLTTAQRSLPLYPWMHVAPNGQVFNSGPNIDTAYLNTAGTGTWSLVANSHFGFRDYGSAVLYDDGKVLVVGGGNPPTATAEVIDLNAPSPSWRNVAPMANARRQMNATLLPDGTVLVTDGTSSSGFNDATNGVLVAELWNPSTENWTQMASMQNRRTYHSTTILLPDGRVLTAGGGRPKPTGDTDHPDAEIYSPPYLFKGTRPVITAAPDSVTYGQTFSITTPEAATIGKVTWIAISSVTHAFDMNQRINRLSFSSVAGGLNIVAPSNVNLCPPGYYMLFILNSSGVPSLAKIVRIDASTSTLPAAPSNLVANAVSASQINLSWADNANNEDGFRIEMCQGAGCTNFAEIGTVAANVVNYSSTGLTASTTYQYRVRAFKSVDNSTYSNIASASTLGIPPVAPSNLVANAVSSSQINLSWADNANNEDGFRIERCQGASCTNFAEIGTVATNVVNYSSTGLTASTTYQYRVRAFKSVDNSTYSNIASASTLGIPPVAPSNLVANAVSSSQINLSWSDNANNEDGFRIEMCQGAGCTNFAEIGTVAANVVNYSSTGLTASTTYQYRVRAFNSIGTSIYSNTSSTPTLDLPLTAPTNLTATALPNRRFTLTWIDNSNNEVGFKIERCTNSTCENFAQIATVSANVTVYTDSPGGPGGRTYRYRVRAYNSGNNSPYSNIVDATAIK